MTSFTDYSKHIFQSPKYPEVHFGICNERDSLDESTNMPFYYGHLDTDPENLGYKRIEVGVFTHPKNPGKLFTFHGDVMKEHETADAAHDEVFKHRTLYSDELDTLGHDLMKHYHHSKYSLDHKTAIQHYTDAWSLLNTYIIRKADLSDAMLSTVGHLDSAMHVNKLPRDLTVYSGMNPDHSKIVRENPIVHHPSFMSTSISLSKARAFADRGHPGVNGDIVAIHLPKGHSGIYAGDMSSIPSEKELILPRHTNLIIDPHKKEVVYDMNSKQKFLIHHAYPKV